MTIDRYTLVNGNGLCEVTARFQRAQTLLDVSNELHKDFEGSTLAKLAGAATHYSGDPVDVVRGLLRELAETEIAEIHKEYGEDVGPLLEGERPMGSEPEEPHELTYEERTVNTLRDLIAARGLEAPGVRAAKPDLIAVLEEDDKRRAEAEANPTPATA